jgi:hypothetical protein
MIELEAERCSLDSVGAFTDEHYHCGPAVTRGMHSDDTAYSQMPYLFKSSQGFKRQQSKDVVADAHICFGALDR